MIEKGPYFLFHMYPKSFSAISILSKYFGPGAIQVLRNADGGGRGVTFSGKKRYEGVRFNVISVTRGWVGVQFPEKSVM